jgi:hypothetical protein
MRCCSTLGAFADHEDALGEQIGSPKARFRVSGYWDLG